MNERPVEDLSFEEALQELEAIIAALEQGDLPLEDAVRLFERGRRLWDHCSRLLNQARLRVRFLIPPEEIPEDLRPFLDTPEGEDHDAA